MAPFNSRLGFSGALGDSFFLQFFLATVFCIYRWVGSEAGLVWVLVSELLYIDATPLKIGVAIETARVWLNRPDPGCDCFEFRFSFLPVT